jgi:hypothetical protein
MLFLILSSVSYQEEMVDERVSFRIGGGDCTFEILDRIEYGESIETTIVNLDGTKELEFVVIWVDASVPAMNEGHIDWEVASQLAEVQTVAPGESMVITTDEPKIYHLIIMHNSAENVDDVIEVRVLNDYGDDVMWQAIALSLPSLWMTGFVIHRLKRLKVAGRSFIDSTPSHLWEEE